MTVLQNKCFRTVAGAFRAAPVSALEVETYVARLSLEEVTQKALASPYAKI